MYYVYFIKSLRNDKIYTGLTENNPKERLKQNNQGSNKWAKENRPFVLVYFERYYCKRDAEARELFYKSGFGRKIRNIIFKEIKY